MWDGGQHELSILHSIALSMCFGREAALLAQLATFLVTQARFAAFADDDCVIALLRDDFLGLHQRQPKQLKADTLTIGKLLH